MDQHTKKAGVVVVVLGSLLAGGRALQRPFRGLSRPAAHAPSMFHGTEQVLEHSSGMRWSTENSLGHSKRWAPMTEPAGVQPSDFAHRFKVPASGRTVQKEVDQEAHILWPQVHVPHHALSNPPADIPQQAPPGDADDRGRKKRAGEIAGLFKRNANPWQDAPVEREFPNGEDRVPTVWLPLPDEPGPSIGEANAPSGGAAPAKPTALAELQTEQADAIAKIWNSGGSFTVDQTKPDKPVIGVRAEGHLFNDAGLEHLKRLTQLQRLDLGDARVTDAGVEHIEGLTQLRWLNLAGTPVTDAGLRHIKGLTRLQTLILLDTKVTNPGAESLRKTLPVLEIRR